MEAVLTTHFPHPPETVLRAIVLDDKILTVFSRFCRRSSCDRELAERQVSLAFEISYLLQSLLFEFSFDISGFQLPISGW